MNSGSRHYENGALHGIDMKLPIGIIVFFIINCCFVGASASAISVKSFLELDSTCTSPTLSICMLDVMSSTPVDTVRVIAEGGIVYTRCYTDQPMSALTSGTLDQNDLRAFANSVGNCDAVVASRCTDQKVYTVCFQVDDSVRCYKTLSLDNCNQIVSGKTTPGFETLQQILASFFKVEQKWKPLCLSTD